MSYESSIWVKDQITRMEGSDVGEMFTIQFIRSENKIDVVAYLSDSAIAQPLSNNIKKPKMCAAVSKNLDPVAIYGGSNNVATEIASLEGSNWLFENGTSANSIGRWNATEGIAYLQTKAIGPKSFNTQVR